MLDTEKGNYQNHQEHFQYLAWVVFAVLSFFQALICCSDNSSCQFTQLMQYYWQCCTASKEHSNTLDHQGNSSNEVWCSPLASSILDQCFLIFIIYLLLFFFSLTDHYSLSWYGICYILQKICGKTRRMKDSEALCRIVVRKQSVYKSTLSMLLYAT